MGKLEKVAKVLGIVLVALVAMAGMAYGWASWKTSSVLEQTHEAHEVDFPVPFPLTEAEIEALREERREPPDGEERETAEPAPAVDPLEGVDLDAIAKERAVERGEHLVQAIYACVECHGDDFSGGVMMDDPALGTLRGPNLTGGAGSRVADWSPGMWDRVVRHGIRPDGHASWMPSEDYQRMSDRELSDIISYIRSFPAVDNEVAAIRLGPLGTILVAVAELTPSVDNVVDHHAAHVARPPEATPTAEYGEHLAGVCTGCHRADFTGGPVVAGAPDWLPARNLTPHEQGLAGWEYEDFVTAMREMRRPDGTELGVPMTLMRRYTANMSDVELQALWAYLQTLDPRPTGT